jgi:fermentation-respiration switch protein FrsA (DUF1100 family)
MTPPPAQRTRFPGFGGALLDARLDLPPGEPVACALFAHCFTCGKDVRGASAISRSLAEAGIAVLRFDFTGIGSSDGDFANSNFSSNVEDLLAAAAYLERDHEGPALLVGHSLGGAAVIAAAARLRGVRAVATIGAPFDPAHVRGLLGADLEDIERDGVATVHLAGRPFQIKKQFLDDIQAQEMGAAIGGLRRPLLIFHSPTDETVGIENASLIFEAARHPKSFVSLMGADHLLSRRSDAAYVAGVLGAWASRYVRPEGTDGPQAT